MRWNIYILLSFLIIFSCKNDEEIDELCCPPDDQEIANVPNVLLIITDDMGLDATPG